MDAKYIKCHYNSKLIDQLPAPYFQVQTVSLHCFCIKQSEQ